MQNVLPGFYHFFTLFHNMISQWFQGWERDNKIPVFFPGFVDAWESLMAIKHLEHIYTMLFKYYHHYFYFTACQDKSMGLNNSTLTPRTKQINNFLPCSPMCSTSHKILVSILLAWTKGQSCSSALVEFSSTTWDIQGKKGWWYNF